MNDKLFARLVDLLTAKSYDSEAMVIRLAKTNPKLFVQLAEYKEPIETFPKWQHEAVHYLLDGQTVAAIKAVRASSGLGLKESKDVINALCWSAFNDHQIHDMPDYSYPELTAVQAAIVYELNKIRKL